MAEKPIFPDCAFPDGCQCAPRGYEHEMDSCAVPRTAAVAAVLGLDPAKLFGREPPSAATPPDTRTDPPHPGSTMLRGVLANNLRRLRHADGLSQAALAVQAGLNRIYVGMIEREEHAATVDVLQQLAAVFAIEPSELLQSGAAGSLVIP